MSEYLLVRLSKQPQAKGYWWIGAEHATTIEKSGEIASWTNIDELVPHAEGRPVIVLLSGADVVMKTVSLPAGGARQYEKMLPYLVEDELAQDVDTLHFSVLAKQENQVYTAAVERDWLSCILEQFEACGLQVENVLPDVLALPEEEHATAVQFDHEWMIRQGPFSGICIENSWLPIFTRMNENTEENPVVEITSYSRAPETNDLCSQVWTEKLVDSIDLLLYRGALSSPITLLTGAFKKSSSVMKYWQIWRGCLVALVALITLMLIHHAVDIRRMSQEATALRTESEHIFRTIFPDRHKIPTVSYLKGQFTSEINKLSGSEGQDSALSLFTSLAETIGRISGIQLQRIHYDGARGDIRIDVKGADFQAFEATRQKLSQKFDVQQGPLNRDNNQVSGSFILKNK
ncbi:Type II secretion system protein L [Vibrio ruber DSM 16370]|uniref:Type II secretion system protein L n=1 Tax=Vibrio ruber (strain DSM 16370 / JCM 11486 / BCRC 17186 / CECT 7878 / LMG 23124 / VR1) TaxID=1123498 RepID=A0A1R4LPK7_VIBR1|nr:type II secretion system protein GspL [Vibrio ruber]SJN58541.1 Type II secretion system protein L [Vibrio ruber DSM 16370]